MGRVVLCCPRSGLCPRAAQSVGFARHHYCREEESDNQGRSRIVTLGNCRGLSGKLRMPCLLQSRQGTGQERVSGALRRPKNGQKSRIPRKTRPDKGPGDSPGRDPGAGKIHRRVSRGNWLAPAPGSTGRNHCRRFPSMPKSTEGKRGRIPRGCRKPRHMQKEQNPGTRPGGFPHRSITPLPTAGVPCLEDTWHRRASQQPLARAPAV